VTETLSWYVAVGLLTCMTTRVGTTVAADAGAAVATTPSDVAARAVASTEPMIRRAFM
jgi:hypothetical protein